MSNFARLTNTDQVNKILHLSSYLNSQPLTQTILSHQQPHTQPKKTRKRGVILTEQGRQKLVQAGVLYDDFSHRYTYEELGERSLLDSRTVSRILSCEIKVDKRTLKAFFCAFNLSLEVNDYARAKFNIKGKTTINLAHYPSLSAATTKKKLSVEELAELIPGMMQDVKSLLELFNYEQLQAVGLKTPLS